LYRLLLTVRSRLVPSGSLSRVQLRLEVVSVGIPVSWLSAGLWWAASCKAGLVLVYVLVLSTFARFIADVGIVVSLLRSTYACHLLVLLLF